MDEPVVRAAKTEPEVARVLREELGVDSVLLLDASGRELRLYECAPWSPEAWASPSITCPLIATR